MLKGHHRVCGERGEGREPDRLVSSRPVWPCPGMSRVIRTAGIRRGVGLSIACSLLHLRPSLTDAEVDWALPHGELYGFPSRAGVFAAFSMPGENRFRIFGAVPSAHGLSRGARHDQI
jgi:hypothetical protein